MDGLGPCRCILLADKVMYSHGRSCTWTEMDRVGRGVGGGAGGGELRQGLGGVQPRPEGQPAKVLALAPDAVGCGPGHVPQGLLRRQPLRPPEEGGRAGGLVVVERRLDLWDRRVMIICHV